MAPRRGSKACGFQLSKTPAQVDMPAPNFGRDTALVLAELGYDVAQIAALVAASVLT